MYAVLSLLMARVWLAATCSSNVKVQLLLRAVMQCTVSVCCAELHLCAAFTYSLLYAKCTAPCSARGVYTAQLH